MPKNGYHPIELRIQILGLISWGVEAKDIATKLEVPIRSIRKMIQRAKDRGFNPGSCERIRMEYAEDAKRSGRPKEITPEKEKAIIESVSKDRNGREKSSEILAYEAGISHSSVLRILKRNGFVIAKPSWKPGLTEAAKAKRLKFCLDHQHWTLDDWKNVIWTDETAVVLGHRRGSLRVWRTVEDRYNITCVRRRWKGASDFMVWACFSYDKKGPIHIWEPETSQQKKQAEIEIEALNQELEPIRRAEWEMNTTMNRLHLRGIGGRKPTWKWNEKNGKCIQNAKKGGIDWWRYQKVRFF
jgi:transposase